MKRFLIVVALTAIAIISPALAADVAVSVSIGDPGFYGRIDIGGYPPPLVIYREPRAIYWVPADRAPIYLRVPPGHAKHWSKHCHKYDACGERVYFVQDRWYSREYAPRYREQHRERHDERHDQRKEDRKEERGGKQKHERHGNDHDRGRGR